jgi:hypothetical protein
MRFMSVHAFRSNDGSYSLQVSWVEPNGASGQLTLYIDSKDAWQLPVLNTEPSEIQTVNAVLAFTTGTAAGTGPRLCVALPPGSKIRTGEHVVCAVGPGATCVFPFVKVRIIECCDMVSAEACLLIEHSTKPSGAALPKGDKPSIASTFPDGSGTGSPLVAHSEPKKAEACLVLSDFEMQLSKWGTQQMILNELLVRFNSEIINSVTVCSNCDYGKSTIIWNCFSIA